MKTFFKALAAYYLIGLVITSCVWACDETSTAADLIGVPILAPFWPLLLFLVIKT